MKRLIAGALALFSALTFGATLNPIQLLNPAGSTNGQAITSTGPTTAPIWKSVASSGANSNITSLTGLTTPLSVPQGGTGRSSDL